MPSELCPPFRLCRLVTVIGISTLAAFPAYSETGYRVGAPDTPVSLFSGFELEALAHDVRRGHIDVGLAMPFMPHLSYRQSATTNYAKLTGQGSAHSAQSMYLSLPLGLSLEAGKRRYGDGRDDAEFIGLSFSTRRLGAYEKAQERHYQNARLNDDPPNMWLRTASTLTLLAVLAGGGGGGSQSPQTPQSRQTPQTPDTPTTLRAASTVGNWGLVWSDEFDGASLDAAKWNTGDSYGRDQCFGGGNNEQQCYATDNIALRDGNLVLTAQAENGLAQGRSYTSGRIQSRGKGDFTYGRFEARIKLPAGQGSWPAFWMLPSDQTYGTWAASGEIDVMEAVNLGTPCVVCDGGQENRIHGSLHFGGTWPQNASTSGLIQLDDYTGFNTYALEWYETEMRWYVNGTQYSRKTYDQWNSRTAPDDLNAPFDQDFHLIFNLAIGGNWPGPSDGQNFPRTMEVDYVRVYECDAGGNACLPD